MTEELPGYFNYKTITTSILSIDNTVETLPLEDNRDLIEKIADKNWKVRVNAYEELKKKIGELKSSESSSVEAGAIFNSSDDLLREYGNKKMYY